MIAGLDPKTFEPFIASMDLIGCPMVTDDFVVSGTCSEQMYGMCESVWEPNMVCHVTRSIMVILYNCVDTLRHEITCLIFLQNEILHSQGNICYKELFLKYFKQFDRYQNQKYFPLVYYAPF